VLALAGIGAFALLRLRLEPEAGRR